MGAVPRSLWCNVINSAATAEAVRQFTLARLRRSSLIWLKTDHIYPAHRGGEAGGPRLGEILARLGLPERLG